MDDSSVLQFQTDEGVRVWIMKCDDLSPIWMIWISNGRAAVLLAKEPRNPKRRQIVALHNPKRRGLAAIYLTHGDFRLMVLLIDNFDSFVFNLARYFRELGVETQVVRNNAITIAEVEALRPHAIVLSPGPCTPNEAGICVELIRSLHRQFPIFGVCLGHQAIGAAFGAIVSRAPEPVHGRTSLIQHSGSRLFEGIANPFRAARYHSLIVEEATLPPELIVTARTADGLVMAIEHASLPVCSVQFHPESVLTESGQRLLANFLRIAGLTITAEPTGDALGSESIGEWLHDELSDAVDSRWVIDGASERPLHW